MRPSLPVLAILTALATLPSARRGSDEGVSSVEQGVRIPAAPGLAPPRAEPALPLGVSLVEAYEEGADLVALPPPSAAELAEVARKERDGAACGAKFRRFGFVRELTEDQSRAVAQGWRAHELAPGDVVWTAAVRTPAALGTRLRIEHVDLGADELRIWAWSEDVLVQRGPYAGRGPRPGGVFWTPSLPGGTAFLEVRGGDEPPALEVTAIAHFDRPPGGAPAGASDGGATNGMQCPPPNADHSCQQDVMCSSLEGGLLFARDATAHVSFIQDGMCGGCTGTLVNDLDPASQVLFFLTAFHCITSQGVADTLEAVWLYQTPSCGGAEPNWFALDRNCGGTLLETSPDSGGNDMSFLRLDGSLQPGVAFAGFSSGEAAGILSAIHHPRGAPKRFASLTLSGLSNCSIAFDPFDYDVLEATLGLLEGGSSGAGLFDNGGILFGHQSGNCCEAWLGGSCQDASCFNQSDWRSAFGESEETWPLVRKWLESGGTLRVDKSNTTPPFEGTPADPYPTIAMALANAFPGARLLVQAGSYDEAVVLDVQLDPTGGTVVVGD